MLLIALVLASFTATVVYFRRGQHLMGVFLSLFSLYEFTGPVLYSGVFGEAVPRAQQIFSARASDDAVFSFTWCLLAFVILVVISYELFSLFFLRYNIGHPGTAWPLARSSDPKKFYFLVFIVFVFGVISAYTGAGEVRLLNYAGEDLPVTPAFFYGGALLVSVMAVALFYYLERKWIALLLIAGAVAPLVYEVILSSRRQNFAPSALLVIFLILYSRKVSSISKLFLTLTFVLGALVLFSFQFWVRAEFGATPTDAGLFTEILAPQLGEFGGIGATTLYAWTDIVLGNDPVTFGGHWVLAALNSVPFLKFGDLLFPAYASGVAEATRTLAPFGGLSFLADALRGWGVTGVVALAILTGGIVRYWHEPLKRYLNDGVKLSIRGVYAISLITTLILKYRSGLGDALQTFVSFTILYYSVVLVGLLIKVRPSRSPVAALRSP